MSGRYGDLGNFRHTLNILEGKRCQLQEVIEKSRGQIRGSERDYRNAEDAQMIIQAVAQQTQSELEFHISEIVTLALAAVFEEPYELKVKFEMRAGRTEVDILFMRDGEELDPLEEAGGGPIDIVAFALRLALWSMSRPKTRGTIVLDEPFRDLSRDLQPKASTMLRVLSEKLGLQIIMISHSEDLIEGADKIFQVGIHGGVSHITEGVDRIGKNKTKYGRSGKVPPMRRRRTI